MLTYFLIVYFKFGYSGGPLKIEVSSIAECHRVARELKATHWAYQSGSCHSVALPPRAAQ